MVIFHFIVLSVEKYAKISSVAFYCINPKCPAKNRRGMQHFVQVLDIYEVGPKILDRLQEEGLISDAADLFLNAGADSHASELMHNAPKVATEDEPI